MASETAEGRGLSRSRLIAASLVLVVALLALYLRLRPPAPSGAPGRLPRGRGSASTDLPRIDLARLSSPAAATRAGRRDLFGFGEPEAGEVGGEKGGKAAPPPTPVPVANPNPSPRSRRRRASWPSTSNTSARSRHREA